jgi:hypothetical protein
MIEIKSYKFFTVQLLEADDMNDLVPCTANYAVVNTVYDTIDMYEMSEVKAINNAELMNYEKQGREDRAKAATVMATTKNIGATPIDKLH